MSFRYPKGGFITAFYDPLQVPNAPTSVSATGGDSEATVTFTAPTNVGGSAITGYVAQSVPGGISATGASSPITVTGLTNDTAYTINVAAINSYGPGPYGTSGSVTPAAPRGLFGGGNISTGNTNVIQYITISSTGNATDFGDLVSANTELSSCSSSTRGVWGGGGDGSSQSAGVVNVIQYVTISTTGNTSDFGDLTESRSSPAGTSNSTRGIFFGGNTYDGEGSIVWINVIDYITIASVSNATDFGDLTTARGRSGACASTTRAVVGGGEPRTASAFYVTIATTGNVTSFGNLTESRVFLAGCSSNTRGIFAGGAPASGVSNVIDYITIATTGNATDFGDLTVARQAIAACSSLVTGVFAGGSNSGGTRQNVIDYVTIASAGNATDFGDLLAANYYLAGCSNAHGGL